MTTPRPEFQFVLCTHCEEQWGDVDVDPRTGLCIACRIELQERPADDCGTEVAEDYETHRRRAAERREAQLQEARKLMARWQQEDDDVC